MVAIEQTIKQVANQLVEAQFYKTQTAITIKNARDNLHKRFQMGQCAHPLGYRGVNLGFTTEAQWGARHVTMAKQQANAHVLARLHPLSS